MARFPVQLHLVLFTELVFFQSLKGTNLVPGYNLCMANPLPATQPPTHAAPFHPSGLNVNISAYKDLCPPTLQLKIPFYLITPRCFPS
jgi:hypothetical protein